MIVSILFDVPRWLNRIFTPNKYAKKPLIIPGIVYIIPRTILSLRLPQDSYKLKLHTLLSRYKCCTSPVGRDNSRSAGLLHSTTQQEYRSFDAGKQTACIKQSKHAHLQRIYRKNPAVLLVGTFAHRINYTCKPIDWPLCNWIIHHTCLDDLHYSLIFDLAHLSYNRLQIFGTIGCMDVTGCECFILLEKPMNQSSWEMRR